MFSRRSELFLLVVQLALIVALPLPLELHRTRNLSPGSITLRGTHSPPCHEQRHTLSRAPAPAAVLPRPQMACAMPYLRRLRCKMH